MKPRKKGQQWEISYRCPGYSKPIYERFPSYEAAKLRIAEIEYEKSIGQLRPPPVSVLGDNGASKKFTNNIFLKFIEVYPKSIWIYGPHLEKSTIREKPHKRLAIILSNTSYCVSV